MCHGRGIKGVGEEREEGVTWQRVKVGDEHCAFVCAIEQEMKDIPTKSDFKYYLNFQAILALKILIFRF